MEKTMPRGGKRPGAGRPMKYGKARLSEPTLIHSTKEMKTGWERAARTAEKELLDWMRDTLNKAAGIHSSTSE